MMALKGQVNHNADVGRIAKGPGSGGLFEIQKKGMLSPTGYGRMA